MARKQANGHAAFIEPIPIELAPGVRAQVVEVTPELAERWLKKNHEGNRSLGERTVTGMVNDMQAGKWRLTHQAIAFNGDGHLIDGQHRLTAVVMAQLSVRMLVVWNDESDLKDPIDRNRPRSLGFITGQKGNVVAALRVLRSLETGYDVQSVQTVVDVDEGIVKHGEAFDFITQSVSGVSKLLAGTLAAAVWALPLNREGVILFLHKAVTGEMLAATDPAYALRSWRERNRNPEGWHAAMASLNCLRYHLHGRPLAAVYTTDSGYRAITGKRRDLKVPHTPGTDLVQPMGFAPTSQVQ